MPTLLFYYPDKEKRWRVEVEQDRFTIGRSRDVEICVPHSSVSKKHLLIERRGPRYFFRDLGSKNGIYLNEFRKARGTLTDGDELRLGSIRVTFYRAAPPASALQPPAAPAAPLEDPGPDGPVDGAPELSTAAANETIAIPAEAVPAPRPREELDPEALEEVPSLDLDLELELPPEGGGDTLDADGLEAVENADDDDAAKIDVPAPRPRRSALPRAAPAPGAKRNDAPAPRRLPLPLLLAAAAGFVGLGLFLGHLGSLLDEAPPPGEPPATETSSSATPAALPAKEAAPASPPAPDTTSPLGPPADLDDTETRVRLVVRLHLDLLDRPATRDEIEKTSPFHDRLWYELVTKAEFRAGEDPGRVFSLLLGRKPQAAELKTLLDAAEGDMDRFAFMVGTSREYAASTRRRKRSALQLTRSLFVNLLDMAPGSEASAKLLGEIADAKGAIAPFAKALALSEESRAEPRPGEAPDRWLAGAYERLLLRRPSAEEKRRGLEAIAARESGWRDVLAELAARDEYLEY